MNETALKRDQTRKTFGMFPVPTDDLLHVAETELPWAPLDNVGSLYQIPIVDLNTGMYMSNVRLQPGGRFETHYHTGMILGVTKKGAWYYLEYPEILNVAGSFLVEPAASLHTLAIPDDQEGMTEASFVLNGANVNLDDQGNITTVVDAKLAMIGYKAACKKLGQSCEKMIVIGG